MAANLDLVALIVTINYPETSTVFIDRFLASAEAYRIPACLIFNKTDLYSEDENEYLEALKTLYNSLNYPVFKISAINSTNINALTSFFKDKTTLISGNSGVGKSTLINSIAPHSMAKTGEISSYHNKGMHTTTFSEMFELKDGGAVIDTPGIKGFGTSIWKRERSIILKKFLLFRNNADFQIVPMFTNRAVQFWKQPIIIK